MNNQIEQIAKQLLGLQTLKTQNSDSADFQVLAVWQIKSALEAAFKAGQESAK